MPQLVISRPGPPAEVLELQPLPRPQPGPGEVLVRMRAAAVNPADLNFIEGTYGRKPAPGAIPGMEGVGVIESTGDGVTGLEAGTAVLPLPSPGNWASWRVLSAAEVLPLKGSPDPAQAALLRINPATAWGLLHAAGPPEPGTWVVQNAASSAAGHCVIQIARSLGCRTLNFVRRPESIPVCTALGADLTFLDSPEGLAEAKAALAAQQAAAPLLALNAVGGDSALRLMDLLGINGTHLTYGAMSRQSLKVPNGMLIFKTLTLRGFWLTRWQESMSPAETADLYRRLAVMMADGSLIQQIAASYPLTEYLAALEHASRSGRDGKVILTFP